MGKKMYYYTSTDTMKKILNGKNLYATNLGYVNDAREYVNGLRAIRKVLESDSSCSSYDVDEVINEEMISQYANREKDINFYSISFCVQNDLLSQWTTYSKESGVSIEMEFDLQKEIVLWMPAASSAGEDDTKIEVKPIKIVYCPVCQGEKENGTCNKEIRKLLGIQAGMSEAELKPKVWWASAFIKQKEFSHEQEYRIAFRSMDIAPAPRIDYRTDNHVIKPYLDVRCENGWPITSIMIGPGANQDLVYQSVRFFLNTSVISSGRLMTYRQFQRQIEDYFKCNDTLQEIWERNKNSEFYKKWEEMQMRSTELIDEASKGNWKNMIDNFLAENVKTEEEKEKIRFCSFTKSGIILKKSSIPYIY